MVGLHDTESPVGTDVTCPKKAACVHVDEDAYLVAVSLVQGFYLDAVISNLSLLPNNLELSWKQSTVQSSLSYDPQLLHSEISSEFQAQTYVKLQQSGAAYTSRNLLLRL
jgi:hypothetical protein